MQVSKPDWLRNFLLTINFQILSWTLSIGDWIEIAIDWVLSPINDALELGYNAFQWIQYLPGLISERVDWLLSIIEANFQSFTARVDSLWPAINNWWSAKWNEILDMGNSLRDYANGLLLTLGGELRALWQDFVNTKDSLLSQLSDIRQNVFGLKDTVNSYSQPVQIVIEFGRDIVEFFSEPSVWFEKHLAEILERLW